MPLECSCHRTTVRHVLRAGNKLPVDPARVVCQAVLTIVPVGDEDDHPSAFFDQDRVIDQARNIPDVLLHFGDKFICDVIGHCFADEHSGGIHADSPFSLVGDR